MDILERIRKLYNLSERNNSTEEAAAAAAKIQELCFKHNLELASVLEASGEKPDPYVKFDYLLPGATRFDLGWKRSLFGGVCKANFCKAIYLPRTSRMAVIGQKANFDVAVYEFDYLRREIERLAVDNCFKQGFISSKDKRQYLTGFCEGATSTIYRRLTAAHAYQSQQTTESRALVIVKDKELDKATAEHFPHLRHTRRSFGGNASGLNDGKRAGQSITVNRGVGSTSRTMLT